MAIPGRKGRKDRRASLPDGKGSFARNQAERTREEVLQSVSDVLFPGGLGQKKVAVDSRDADGDTPLHVLVWRADLHGVALLLKAGAPVNAVGDMGETPLHIAVALRLEAIVRALLEAGADPDIRSEFGETPREKAIRAGEPFRSLLEDLPPGKPTGCRSPGPESRA